MADDLVIRISGDITKFDDALKEVGDKTEGLSGKLETIAKASGIAFAALTGEVILSAKAFGDAEAINNRLTQAMQNQGIYSKQLIENYNGIANALSTKTGIDDDEIKNVIAITQGYIGQKQVTEGMTKAILDLAAGKKLDLETSAELISKGIEGQTMALKKMGIVVEEGLSRGERQARILELINLKFGDQAEAANKGLGSIRGLQTAFGNLQEEIGARFAPILERIIKGLTEFFDQVRQNKVLVDLVVSVTAAGLALSGLGLFVGVAGSAFLALRTALLAANIAIGATRLAVMGLVGATGIGLLVLIASEIYLNWATFWPRTQAVFQAVAQNIGGLAAGVGKILAGAFVVHNLDMIRDGYNQVSEIVKKGFQVQIDASQDKNQELVRQEEELLDKKKELADREQAQRDAKDALERQMNQARNEQLKLEAEQASKEQIDLKKAEVEILTKMEDDKYVAVKEILATRLEEIRTLQQEAADQDAAQRALLRDQILAETVEFQNLDSENRASFEVKNQQALAGSLETEASMRQLAAKKATQQNIQLHNQFLADQLKFGKAYALINQAMHSEIYQGNKQAFGELAQLQTSSNATLKAIGKAAAVANIIMKTAESAMNIYSGFATIPIIGQALGIAGAAAAIAFGAEQVGRVTAAAQGGLITGGIPGVDSVPVLAQHGELIAPTANFDEVIGSVRAAREAQKYLDQGGQSGSGQAVTIELTMRGDAVEFFEAKILERQRLNISLLEAT